MTAPLSKRGKSNGPCPYKLNVWRQFLAHEWGSIGFLFPPNNCFEWKVFSFLDMNKVDCWSRHWLPHYSCQFSDQGYLYLHFTSPHNTETFFNRFYWRILPILCLYMRFMLALFWHQTSGIINFFHETGKLKAQFIGFKLQPRLSWKLAPLNNGPIYKVTFKQSSVQVLPKNCSPKTSLDMEDGNKIQPEEEKHSTKLYK